jgi:hypothetical protein
MKIREQDWDNYEDFLEEVVTTRYSAPRNNERDEAARERQEAIRAARENKLDNR